MKSDNRAKRMNKIPTPNCVCYMSEIKDRFNEPACLTSKLI